MNGVVARSTHMLGGSVAGAVGKLGGPGNLAGDLGMPSVGIVAVVESLPVESVDRDPC